MTDKKFDNPEDAYNKFSDKEIEELMKNDSIKVDFNKKEKTISQSNDLNDLSNPVFLYLCRIFSGIFYPIGIIIVFLSLPIVLLTMNGGGGMIGNSSFAGFILFMGIFIIILGYLAKTEGSKYSLNPLPKERESKILGIFILSFIFLGFGIFVGYQNDRFMQQDNINNYTYEYSKGELESDTAINVIYGIIDRHLIKDF